VPENTTMPAVLVVESDPRVMSRIRQSLLGGGAAEFRMICTSRLAEALSCLCREAVAVTLLDLDVQDRPGLAALAAMRDEAPGVPVVVIVSAGREGKGIEAIRLGAQDFIAGDGLPSPLLGRVLTAAIERHRLREELATVARRFRRMIESGADGMVVVNKSGHIRFANPAAETLFGKTVNELVGTPFGFPVVSGDREDLEIPREGRRRVMAEMRVTRITWEGEEALLASLRDVTERKRMEDDLRRLNRDLEVKIKEINGLRAVLEQENIQLREIVKAAPATVTIIGDSPEVQRVLEQVKAVAATDATVLVLGETGTGKSLIARMLHDLSARRERPFVSVNCAGLAPGLIESELFGHEKGAFTGAVSRRLGRFELADKGTIFLDEIAELPLELQAKLLAVLQEGEFERVGGSRTVRVDVRVIAATNRDLNEAVRTGKFRQDLYYRLNVFPIVAPPLRDRRRDIPLLVQHILKRASEKLGRHFAGVSEQSMERLMNYEWPGNVRELEHVIERAAILSKGPYLEIGETLTRDAAREEMSGRLVDVERVHILRVLRRTGWVIEGRNGAAKVLGLHPNTLRYRMRKLGIRRSSLAATT